MTVADLPHARPAGAASPSNTFLALANLDQAALDAFPQAVYLCAGDGRVVRFNDKAVELWGRTPHVGDPNERFCGSFRLYRTDGTLLPHDQCPMATALVSGESFHGEEVVVERPDGQRLRVLVNIAPVKDHHGLVSGAINCFQDISERKRAEEQQRHMVQELKHRVKNTLTTVHSMATFTARDAESIEDFRFRFEARLFSLSRAQELLSACGEKGASLHDLLAQQLQPFGGGESGQVRFAGPDIDLEPATALSLCMVFHELMTNAAKYGALSVEGGQVSVAWEAHSEGASVRTMLLRWIEHGAPPVKPRPRPGFGTRLIRRTIGRLGGEADLRFEPSGLQLLLSIPLCEERRQ